MNDGPDYTVNTGCTEAPASPAETVVELALDATVAEIPDEFGLAQNFPNPFNPSTTIELALPESTPVRLNVYDATGRLVARLVDGPMAAGMHQVRFDASRLPSGVYIYMVEAASYRETRRMVLLK